MFKLPLRTNQSGGGQIYHWQMDFQQEQWGASSSPPHLVFVRKKQMRSSRKRWCPAILYSISRWYMFFFLCWVHWVPRFKIPIYMNMFFFNGFRLRKLGGNGGSHSPFASWVHRCTVSEWLCGHRGHRFAIPKLRPNGKCCCRESQTWFATVP